jgi:hypothetical protein
MTPLRSFVLRLPLVAGPFLFIPSVALAQGWGVVDQPDGKRMATPSFAAAIQAVEQMPMDGALQQRTSRMGLQVLNVLWEDTGRNLGSSVGPNISDVTLQVYEPTPRGDVTHLLPVIRFPNFTDKTADVPADKLWVRVGNQSKGSELVTVPLSEVLANLREYLSHSETLKGSGNLLAKRDTHFLVSAQHVFVPLPATGKAEFNPVIFNYQSSPGAPAVMTLLITREGTSMAVIENNNPSYGNGYGQSLFFNKHGQDSAFTVERKSAVKARIEGGQATADDAGALDEGADMLMIVQVPLKFTEHRREKSEAESGFLGGTGMNSAKKSMAPAPPSASRGAVSDVEAAVIGHGEASSVMSASRCGSPCSSTRPPPMVWSATMIFAMPKHKSTRFMPKATTSGRWWCLSRAAAAPPIGCGVVPSAATTRHQTSSR